LAEVAAQQRLQVREARPVLTRNAAAPREPGAGDLSWRL